MHSSDLGVPLSCNQSFPLSSNLLDPLVWNSIGSNHLRFKCASTYSNSFVIKTTLPSTADDILVKIDYISQSHISQIRIYPSDNYIASSNQFSDKCLCGIKNDIQDMEDCKKALLNDCLQILISGLSDFERAHVDKLIDECVLDKRVNIF